jgi:hypothetical protein
MVEVIASHNKVENDNTSPARNENSAVLVWQFQQNDISKDRQKILKINIVAFHNSVSDQLGNNS